MDFLQEIKDEQARIREQVNSYADKDGLLPLLNDKHKQELGIIGVSYFEEVRDSQLNQRVKRELKAISDKPNKEFNNYPFMDDANKEEINITLDVKVRLEYGVMDDLEIRNSRVFDKVRTAFMDLIGRKSKQAISKETLLDAYKESRELYAKLINKCRTNKEVNIDDMELYLDWIRAREKVNLLIRHMSYKEGKLFHHKLDNEYKQLLGK